MNLTLDIPLLFLGALADLLLISMIPRFIIDIRELYHRDCRRGVDTGFGVFSKPTASRSAALSAIAFADVAPGESQTMEGEVNGSDAIQLEVLGDNAHQA
jgi:hypothetical protein